MGLPKFFLPIWGFLKNNFWALVGAMMILGLLIAADVTKVLETFRNTSPLFLALSFLAGIFHHLFRGLVYHQYFKVSDMDANILKSMRLFLAGQFVNLVTPVGRFLAKPIVAYLISRETKPNSGNILGLIMTATWVILFPLVVSAVIGYSSIALTGRVPAEAHYFMITIALLAGFGLSVGGIAWFFPASFRSFMDWLGDKFILICKPLGLNINETMEKLIGGLDTSFETIRNNPSTFIYSIITITIGLGFTTLVYWLSGISVGIQIPLGLILLLVPIAGVANISPTPGGSGTVEASLTAVMAAVISVNLATALASVLIFRAATHGTGVLLGYIGFVQFESPQADLSSLREGEYKKLTE